MQDSDMYEQEFEQEQSHEDAILEQLIIEGIEYSQGKPPLSLEEFRQYFGIEE